MSLDVGTVKGLLELDDQFTGRLKTAGTELEAFEAKATAGFSDVGEAAKKSGDWLTDYWKKSEQMGRQAESLQTTLSSQAEGLKGVGGGAGAALNSLVLLNQANLAMQVGMSAWSFGRQIAEYFQLDAAIGKATANLLGFGEAAVIAGAHADSLARASQIMGREITDLGIATAVNNQATKEWEQSLNTSASRVEAWRTEIEKARSSGVLEALSKDLESHNFSLKELAGRYQVSVEAMQFFTRETKNAADADKAASDAVHDSNARTLKDLATEMAAHKALRDQELHAAKEIAELKASAVQAEQALDLDRVHRREQTLAQLLQRDIGYEAQRLAQGKISDAQYQQNRLALETQYERQLEIELRNETDIALAQLANRQQKETAEANVRFQQGKISREQYEIEITLINEKYAAQRTGIEERSHTELLRRLDELRQKGLAAGAPAKQFQADWFGATEVTINGIKRLVDAFGDLVDKEKEEQELRRRAGGSFDVTSGNFAQTIAGLGFPGQGESLAHEGYSLQEILAILRGGPKNPPKGPRVPGFASGGIGDFGTGTMVMLHGQEAIVPLGGGGSGGGGLVPRPGGILGSGFEEQLAADEKALKDLLKSMVPDKVTIERQKALVDLLTARLDFDKAHHEMDLGKVQADQRALDDAVKAMAVSADVAKVRADQQAMVDLLTAKVHYDETQLAAQHEITDFIASGGGGNTTVNVNVSVSGVWDARSQRELTGAVKDGLVKELLRQGWRPPLAVRR